MASITSLLELSSLAKLSGWIIAPIILIQIAQLSTSLKEWTLTYVKNKDLIQKKLKSHTEKGNVLTFTFTDKTHEYVLQEELDSNYKGQTNPTTLVCPATPNNLTALIKQWNQLVKRKDLTVVFVNLETHDKWLVHPPTHHLIADTATLELGLKSMFAQVAGLPLPPEPKRAKKVMEEP